MQNFTAKGCTNLRIIFIDHNYLTPDASSKLVESLPIPVEGGILAMFNSQDKDLGAEHNQITDDIIKQAKAKSWIITDGEETEVTSTIQTVETEANTDECRINGRNIYFANATQWTIATVAGEICAKGKGKEVNLSNLKTGLYLLTYQSSDKQKTRKIVLN